MFQGNVLFNDTLNTFYLRLCGVRHMVKDHSDSEKGNPLPPHRLLFPISSKGSFICTIPQTGQHIPQPLLHQSWSTGWKKKYHVSRDLFYFSARYKALCPQGPGYSPDGKGKVLMSHLFLIDCFSLYIVAVLLHLAE